MFTFPEIIIIKYDYVKHLPPSSKCQVPMMTLGYRILMFLFAIRFKIYQNHKIRYQIDCFTCQNRL